MFAGVRIYTEYLMQIFSPDLGKSRKAFVNADLVNFFVAETRDFLVH